MIITGLLLRQYSQYMKNPFGQAVHTTLNRFGLELRLTRNLQAARERERAERQLEPWRLLQHYDVRTVLDIGANEGQFAKLIRDLCPRTLVYSFEPLPDIHILLQRRFRNDPSVVPVPCGLSDGAGRVVMNRSTFSPSSSLLPMAELHRTEYPHSAPQTTVEVDVQRLDDWMTASGLKAGPHVLVKLDVQGHELAVIRGGINTLRQARFAIVEVSFFELYERQPLFDGIYRELRALGYVYRGSLEQTFSHQQDRILFADALFENIFD
ncbi:FkbM family methyltransferase [Thiocapsa roseopersicina]|uniref:FkbM family methyltransferase n=1 Tax=Thiocapsa roseopersicina TaxID=1058 RepID=UPI000B87C36C|nr:FkbM family methyltransferase [Thiocapsa roseopersicina]